MPLKKSNLNSYAWVIVGGDLNTSSRSEAAVGTFKTFVSDDPIPTDTETGGDADTNAGRSRPYDYVLPSFAMTNLLTPVVLSSRTFPNGLVFDSRVYTPLSGVPPVQSTDSGATQMQHMGVLKDFTYTIAATNSGTPPLITTQPQSQTVDQAASATFTVTASGSPALGYQWRFGLTNIAGATASNYTRSNIQPADVGNYSVVVSNSAGTDTSSNATLTLLVPPPVLTILTPDVLQWQGLSNLTYTVQSRTNLDQTNWPALGTAASPNRTIWFTNSAPVEVQRYYRVVYP